MHLGESCAFAVDPAFELRSVSEENAIEERPRVKPIRLFPVAPWMRERVARWTLMIALTPMAIDGITQAMLLRESTNALRIVTGSIAGLAFGYWVLCAIERRDKQLLAQKQQLEPIVDIIDNPARGRRVISARRVQIGGTGEESHMFVTMVEDRTEKMVAAA